MNTMDAKQILEALSVYSPHPDGEPEDVQDEWTELMWCDAIVAGLLTTALQGGRIDVPALREARGLLESHPSWNTRWPIHFDLLTRACELLVRR